MVSQVPKERGSDFQFLKDIPDPGKELKQQTLSARKSEFIFTYDFLQGFSFNTNGVELSVHVYSLRLRNVFIAPARFSILPGDTLQ